MKTESDKTCADAGGTGRAPDAALSLRIKVETPDTKAIPDNGRMYAIGESLAISDRKCAKERLEKLNRVGRCAITRFAAKHVHRSTAVMVLGRKGPVFLSFRQLPDIGKHPGQQLRVAVSFPHHTAWTMA